jgi:hypothetical protein
MGSATAAKEAVETNDIDAASTYSRLACRIGIKESIFSKC